MIPLTPPLAIFLFQLTQNPPFFFAVVITVVVSITLHELAHGWAALKLGDQTPSVRGHMTFNPLVHMPPISMIALFVVGIAWGAMPIDPTRLRGRYGEAIVAVAGPMVNLLLSFLGLTTLGVMYLATDDLGDGGALRATEQFLITFGGINLLLFLFNLLPVPPLDGSHILANFSPAYRRVVGNPNNQAMVLGVFLLVFFFSGRVFAGVFDLVFLYLGLFLGPGESFQESVGF